VTRPLLHDDPDTLPSDDEYVPSFSSSSIERSRRAVRWIVDPDLHYRPACEGSHRPAVRLQAAYVRHEHVLRRYGPLPFVKLPLEQQFGELAEQWARETMHISAIREMILHRAYQRIIGLGPDVVPLILQRMRLTREQWFWALSALTGDDPAQGANTVDEAIAAWIEWANIRGVQVHPAASVDR